MSFCLVLRSSIARSGSLISAEISRVSFSILALSTSGESTDAVPSRASSENIFETRESRVPPLLYREYNTPATIQAHQMRINTVIFLITDFIKSDNASMIRAIEEKSIFFSHEQKNEKN